MVGGHWLVAYLHVQQWPPEVELSEMWALGKPYSRLEPERQGLGLL